jgi:HlyD family secretion protein
MSLTSCIRRAMPLPVLSILAVLAAFDVPHLGAQEPKPRTVRLNCTVEPFARVHLVARVPGYLKKVNADIGDRVQRGDVLAVVDARLEELEYKLAQAVVQRAQGEVQYTDASVAVAQSTLDGARGLIAQRKSELDRARAWAGDREMVLKRNQQLFATRSIEEHLVDEARKHLDKARAAATAAEGALANAKADVAVKESNVAKARAAHTVAAARVKEATASLEKAQLMVDFASVRAPFDGVITQRNYFEFDYVRSPDTPGQQPIFVIERMDKMRVLLDVPDRYLPYIKRGDAVSLSFEEPIGQVKGAKISRLGGSEDPKTRTMRIEIDVPNPDRKLWAGMTGTATLQLPR